MKIHELSNNSATDIKNTRNQKEKKCTLSGFEPGVW